MKAVKRTTKPPTPVAGQSTRSPKPRSASARPTSVSTNVSKDLQQQSSQAKVTRLQAEIEKSNKYNKLLSNQLTDAKKAIDVKEQDYAVLEEDKGNLEFQIACLTRTNKMKDKRITQHLTHMDNLYDSIKQMTVVLLPKETVVGCKRVTREKKPPVIAVIDDDLPDEVVLDREQERQTCKLKECYKLQALVAATADQRDDYLRKCAREQAKVHSLEEDITDLVHQHNRTVNAYVEQLADVQEDLCKYAEEVSFLKEELKITTATYEDIKARRFKRVQQLEVDKTRLSNALCTCKEEISDLNEQLLNRMAQQNEDAEINLTTITDLQLQLKEYHTMMERAVKDNKTKAELINKLYVSWNKDKRYIQELHTHMDLVETEWDKIHLSFDDAKLNLRHADECVKQRGLALCEMTANANNLESELKGDVETFLDCTTQMQHSTERWLLFTEKSRIDLTALEDEVFNTTKTLEGSKTNVNALQDQKEEAASSLQQTACELTAERQLHDISRRELLQLKDELERARKSIVREKKRWLSESEQAEERIDDLQKALATMQKRALAAEGESRELEATIEKMKIGLQELNSVSQVNSPMSDNSPNEHDGVGSPSSPHGALAVVGGGGVVGNTILREEGEGCERPSAFNKLKATEDLKNCATELHRLKKHLRTVTLQHKDEVQQAAKDLEEKSHEVIRLQETVADMAIQLQTSTQQFTQFKQQIRDLKVELDKANKNGNRGDDRRKYLEVEISTLKEEIISLKLQNESLKKMHRDRSNALHSPTFMELETLDIDELACVEQLKELKENIESERQTRKVTEKEYTAKLYSYYENLQNILLKVEAIVETSSSINNDGLDTPTSQTTEPQRQTLLTELQQLRRETKTNTLKQQISFDSFVDQQTPLLHKTITILETPSNDPLSIGERQAQASDLLGQIQSLQHDMDNERCQQTVFEERCLTTERIVLARIADTVAFSQPHLKEFRTLHEDMEILRNDRENIVQFSQSEEQRYFESMVAMINEQSRKHLFGARPRKVVGGGSPLVGRALLTTFNTSLARDHTTQTTCCGTTASNNKYETQQPPTTPTTTQQNTASSLMMGYRSSVSTTTTKDVSKEFEDQLKQVEALQKRLQAARTHTPPPPRSLPHVDIGGGKCSTITTQHHTTNNYHSPYAPSSCTTVPSLSLPTPSTHAMSPNRTKRVYTPSEIESSITTFSGKTITLMQSPMRTNTTSSPCQRPTGNPSKWAANEWLIHSPVGSSSSPLRGSPAL